MSRRSWDRAIGDRCSRLHARSGDGGSLGKFLGKFRIKHGKMRMREFQNGLLLWSLDSMEISRTVEKPRFLRLFMASRFS